MSDKRSKLVDSSKTGHKKPQDFSALSRKILKLANRGAPRIQFLRELSRMLIQFSGCDAVELRITDGKLNYRWEARDDGKPSFEILPSTTSEEGNIIPCSYSNSATEQLCRIIASGKPDPSLPFLQKTEASGPRTSQEPETCRMRWPRGSSMRTATSPLP